MSARLPLSPSTVIRSSRRWLPLLLVALPILIITVFVWRALVDEEERQLDRVVATDLARIESATSLRISTRVQTLDRMAERWQFSGRPAEEDWEHSATLVLRDYDGFQSVEWVSPAYDQFWGVTSEADGTLVGDNIQDQETLRKTADPRSSSPRRLPPVARASAASAPNRP